MNRIFPGENSTAGAYCRSPPARPGAPSQLPAPDVVSIAPSGSVPATNTFPSGSATRRGNSDTVRSGSDRQSSPSHICGTVLVRMVSPSAKLPDITSTLPSGRDVAVGYQRPRFIAGNDSHSSERQSNRMACSTPTLSRMWPPTTSRRPSGRKAWPEQNRLYFFPLARSIGCFVGRNDAGDVALTGCVRSQSCGVHSCSSMVPSGRSRRPQNRTFPLGSKCA